MHAAFCVTAPTEKSNWASAMRFVSALRDWLAALGNRGTERGRFSQGCNDSRENCFGLFADTEGIYSPRRSNRAVSAARACQPDHAKYPSDRNSGY